MIGIASNNAYRTAYNYQYPMHVSPDVPRASVVPVPPVPSVKAGSRQADTAAIQPASVEFPPIRKGADPVEMAVRGRIQYMDPVQGKQDAAGIDGTPDTPKSEKAKADDKTEPEEACQTCKNRKYQDGSDDPGVSFKTATRLTPKQAETAVRGHEMEHVSHERARAEREGRKIVHQSVTIHTAICPECGDVYVSGGTTRTATVKDNREDPFRQARQELLGRTLDTIA